MANQRHKHFPPESEVEREISSLRAPFEDKWIPGVLSFLLPGLGQIYRGRVQAGVVFFIPFALLIATPKLVSFIPLVPFLSAIEAQFRKANEKGNSQKRKSRRRLNLFLVVGFLSFMGWFAMVSPVMSPVGAQMRISRDADEIAEAVRSGKRQPELLDPWNRPYDVSIVNQTLSVRSRGRDGIADNDDDFYFKFRL